MQVTIREATSSDLQAIKPLFPRLADFEVPPNRNSDHLWQGDLALLEKWEQGEASNCFVLVASDEIGKVQGVSMTTLCEELMSHEPSAHLEVLAVAKGAEGNGIGGKLIDRSEKIAKERGAQSITLHVFGNNKRARGLYQHAGYDEELIRCIKHF
jgi:ribosomal protein S18 acetylase RimI-like enzyme